MTTLKELIRKEQAKRDKKHDALSQQYATLKKEFDELKREIISEVAEVRLNKLFPSETSSASQTSNRRR